MEGMSNDWMTRYFKSAVFTGQVDESRVQLSLVALTGAMMVDPVAAGRHFEAHQLPDRIAGEPLLDGAGLPCFAEMPQDNATMAIIGPALIGAGLAAVFPVVLGYVGDRYPQQSGTAFSTIFVIALAGNMLINKTFGHIAHDYGVQQYPKVLLVALAAAAVLLHFLNNLRQHDNTG